ncbi:FeoB-associated Cys-rich membrane protein [Jeotgalibacillus salarius]|uniref:FeoB-associated Cys-rich membrane protein n=1 Tax=Jeotgalibacillus salarius TaxID=546023 RepID=UPI00141BBD98|nr:FeoB-associated Cys-rich membrane protein [Jeotgalibacillus salarius]
MWWLIILLILVAVVVFGLISDRKRKKKGLKVYSEVREPEEAPSEPKAEDERRSTRL